MDSQVGNCMCAAVGRATPRSGASLPRVVVMFGGGGGCGDGGCAWRCAGTLRISPVLQTDSRSVADQNKDCLRTPAPMRVTGG